MPKALKLDGQTSMFDSPLRPSFGCRGCPCETCLMWRSDRCPYGTCYDDHRAAVNPYDAAHPGQPPRTAWSNWKTDQAYWCRGGVFYPAIYCEHYVRYQGSQIAECLESNVQRFQDGYMRCFIGDKPDCHQCYERFQAKMNK